MSIDPGFSINTSIMAAAFAADAILSALLIFLWLTQRKEKHALFWGLGQLAIMAGSIVWFLGSVYIFNTLRLSLCAILLCLGMAGYWAGTTFFIDALRRYHIRWIPLVLLLMSAGFSLLWHWNESWMVPGSAAAVGVVLCWSGALLMGAKSRYRWLGMTLMLRGGFNILSAIILNPDLYVVWFAVTTILKTLSMLGLIYAVQNEIQQRYVSTVDSLSHGFLIRDRRGYVHVANERCAKLLGYNGPAELIGRHVSELLPGLTRAMADDYFRRFEADGVQYPISESAIFNLHNGARLPVELLGSPYIERGRLYCLVQLLDISERKKKDDLLYQAARTDPVTGYFNRYALSLRLNQQVAEAAAAGRECVVLFIDLDKFKRVNDSFGHAAGDQLLRDSAHRLLSMARNR